MIISHSKKFVFLGVPRTGSTAMHAALKQLSGKSWKYYGKHLMAIPEECMSYFTFACVRNPYSRELSHYLYRHTTKGNALFPWVKNWTFQKYIRWSTNPAGSLERYADMPQSTHLAGKRMDRVLRFECLPQAFNTLPFVPKGFALQRQNARLSRQRVPWQTHYTEESAALVHGWAAKDFTSYGYDKDSWRHE